MVIDRACEDAGLPRPYLPIEDTNERRSFFFLGRPEGTLGRKSLRQQSERMLRLFEHQADSSEQIKVVPVSLFWGHQPDKEKSLFKLILSENWSATGRFKKLLSIIFHPHHILVQFSTPVQLSELADEQPDRELQVRKLMRILRVHFNSQKQAILGPDLSHRRTLINSIMESDLVREAIDREAHKTETDRQKVEKKALSYANEIVSDQSYRVIRFFHVLLTWLWHKLYDGIRVHNIGVVKDLARSHEIVYTPCHRSHIDYLLLSYVLYHNGLTPPHIAAGRNLNLPVAGALLRRAGAFYMRRSFAGDALYKAVFDEYLHLMFVRGYSVEYFIEGGRSRTGRMLVPRTGMLSMTVRSFQRDASLPMALMPVYFSYERIIEAPTYMSELAGKDKKQESIFDIFKIFGAFKNPFGKVSVSFGEPVILTEFLDETLPDRSMDSGLEFSAACTTLARRLVINMNAAASVNPVNLVATALLCTPRQIIEESRLSSQVEQLREIAQALGHEVTPLTPNEIIAEAERVAGVKRYSQPFGDILDISADDAILLTYYRNNTAHIYALPSLVARIIKMQGKITPEELIQRCTTIYPFIRAEFFLKWTDDDVRAVLSAIIETLSRQELISLAGNNLVAPPPASEEFSALTDLAEIIEPTLERFFIVVSLLEKGDELSVRDVEANAAATGRQLSAIYGINSPEFFDRSLFSTFITALRNNEVISISDNQLQLHPSFSAIKSATEATLDPDVNYNVLQVAARLK
jgi:glycerol-3-phosphate O-acyltransferase